MPAPTRQPSSRRSDEDVSASIDEVWGRIQARLERGFSRVERLISSLFDRALEPAEREEGAELCEAIGSKLGALGLGASAELMRRAADDFEEEELGMTQALALSSLVDDARVTLATSVAEMKELSHSGQPLAVIGPICEALDEVVWVASSQGMPVLVHTDGVPPVRREIAAVVAVVTDDELGGARPTLRGIREAHPTQPLILLARPAPLFERARVVDVVSLVLPLTTPPLDVVAEVRQELLRARHPRSVALFGVGAEDLAEPLWRRGLAAVVETSPEHLIETIRSGEIRAVVLTADTGELEPDELLRLLRTDRQTRSCIVVVIDFKDDIARAHAALREGADQYFGPDFDMDDLAVTLKARLVRRAELEPLTDAAGLSGVVPWSTATVLIERMLLVSFRQNVPAGVGLIRLSKNADSTLDQDIAREFRGEDVISRVDSDHLVIALQGVGRRVLLRRLGDIHERFGLGELGVRAVGVEFPGDGRSIDELMDGGRSALERAILEDGPAVIGGDWQPWINEAADVMLIDPDPTLGSVLSATLARRGLKVTQRLDAIDAFDELIGGHRGALPRVVIMELDQRGIDGLQLLRQLRDAGVAGRFKIIVLSSRSQESDLRRAFELGIDDFVPKPFSAPLLLHRLRKALDG